MNRSRRSVGRNVVLHAASRNDDQPCAAAVIASRKVGNAVRRNRAKRVVRAALDTIPFTSGVAVVVVARASCARAGMHEVSQELAALAKKLEVTTCSGVV